MTNNSAPPTVPLVHFDTTLFEPEQRFEAWQQNIGVFFDLSSADGEIPDGNIHARIDACNLGDTVFGVTRSESQLFHRNARRVAHDDMDHILVQVFLRGGGLAEGDEKIEAGDMLIIDLDQPHAMLNTNFENLTMVLPRELQSSLSKLLAPLHGKRLSADNPMVRFMSGHLQALWQSVPDMNLAQAGGAVQGTLGLMEGWLSQEGRLPEENPPEVSSALSKAIRRYIEVHLTDNLTPEMLAATFRISRSQIYRIFEPFDGVARYVWDRRMLRSLRMLAQPAFAHLSVGAIAYECGFTSESHFSRAFKARFGKTPGKLRADALEGDPDLTDPIKQSKLDSAKFANWIRDLSRL